ncbi:MAG: tripartite tricarboxylate transporter substrate binding protein [Pseudomonadota bacterium]|nr:tripartite tricarboxylate transporter substrate binding protein [Pseudomonadota bacterium]
MNKAARLLYAAACLWCVSAGALAQAWPAAPVRLIVPFTAGSATDIMARTVGERLSQAFGQPVLVDNRPGAGGTIGAALVAKAAPDGYTLLVVSTGHVVNPVLYPDLTYDTIKDFAGVAPLASLPSVLAVSPSLGYTSVRELVAAAKAKPGDFNYGTAGVGSAAHINSEKFLKAADIKAQHIPFKGTPEMVNEATAGRLQFIWAPIISSVGQVKGGKLTALAVSTPTRSPVLPDVPTIAEAGYPGAQFNFWIGVLAPAHTPRDIVARLNAQINRALQTTEVKERLANMGAVPMSMSPEQFDTYVRDEAAVLGNVMRGTGAKVN